MKARTKAVSPRVPLYVGALVLVLLMGVGVGRAIGPVSTYPADPGQNAGAGSAGPAGGPVVAPDGHIHGVTGGGGATGGAPPIGGLEISSAGYTLAPAETVYAPSEEPRTLSFRIVRDADGTAVTTFAVVHDKPLHLFVVRRDFAGYRHVHPTMAGDGTWTVDVVLDEPGPYRLYADFTATDAAGTRTAVTLGADLAVTGSYDPEELAEPSASASADGITVDMAGTATPGVASPVLFTPSRDGEAVEPEPYLGAFGHLVALRRGDMGFVHVHPEPALTPEGAVKFWVTAPSPGTYALFLDFQVDGEVHTAEYVVTVG